MKTTDDELENNEIYQKLMATPKTGDIGAAFMRTPTVISDPSADERAVYVVHEVRCSHVGTKRRVLGVFSSKDEAERTAAEARFALRRFVERHNGWLFDEEANGGTVLQYWHAGNPLAIVGFAVYVEESVLLTHCGRV